MTATATGPATEREVKYELHNVDANVYVVERVEREPYATCASRDEARERMIATEKRRKLRDEPLDIDLIAALAWCRLGGAPLGRPEDETAFARAKALGLLAQDSTWRATARGEGALIALGLMDGAAAPERVTVHCLWATSERYQRPQFVRAWTDGFVDMRPEQFEQERRDAEEAWAHVDFDGSAWEFFTTAEHLDAPEVPA